MTEENELVEDAKNGLVPVEKEVKIETEPTKDHYMDMGPGFLAAGIPCGFIDGEGKLHDTITVGEMTGYEEDILAGKGPIVPRLNQIISNCTRRFGTLTTKHEIVGAVSEMTAADRLAALIAIRRVSLGDLYHVKMPCPHKECNAVSRFTLDLSVIDIIQMGDQLIRSRKDEFGEEKFVSWHIMSAEDEVWLSGKRKRKEDVITLAMLSRIDAIDIPDDKGGLLHQSLDRKDKDGHRIALKILKALSIRERNKIRALFREHEGSVETEIEFECPACQHEWSADMDVGQSGFFFPSDK